MYSWFRSSDRCIQLLVSESSDSSEVQGAYANVFEFAAKTVTVCLATRILNVYFYFYSLECFSKKHPAVLTPKIDVSKKVYAQSPAKFYLKFF